MIFQVIALLIPVFIGTASLLYFLKGLLTNFQIDLHEHNFLNSKLLKEKKL